MLILNREITIILEVMVTRINIPPQIKGLSAAEVENARRQFGNNIQVSKPGNQWWHILIEMLKEPMLLLLIAVTTIYFIMGEYSEAYFMLAAIVIISGISFYQDNRSQKALEALEKINEPLSKVIRNGMLQSVPTQDLVVGDMMLVEEGNVINADGKIVHSNDFSVNESSITGEAYAVFKSASNNGNNHTDNIVYSGTLVASGLAIAQVEQVGKQTKLGKLGESIGNIKEEPTPLQLQIQKFVRNMAIVGIIVFLLVWLFNYLQSGSLPDSLLKGLTLAMSVLPEEIPVAFTTFMALGSWRLMQAGIIVKRVRTVETLGSASVICTDKTGTITENRMTLQAVYAHATQQLYDDTAWNNTDAFNVITASMWASEPVPFDPMEKTLHEIYEQHTAKDLRRQFSMMHEYPLDGKPPMMTHIFENGTKERIIAAKGAPEAIVAVSSLTTTEKQNILEKVKELAAKGYRILGVATSPFTGNDFPEQQQKLPFVFIGLIAFYDPPKPNIKEVFSQFYTAGIDVKIITGDNATTTRAIAEQAGLQQASVAIDGEDLLKLDKKEMQQQLKDVNIFTRMFPEAKLAAINALKDDNEIVAMTGDGVNDGPALKAAHIGIAMGRKGTEIAKQAAALILPDDDLSKMVDAVAAGRRIYTNIKKAVQYIISIHIPIILTVSLPLFLGWIYPNIFTPVHVIFLELIMGPTCSIVYENEPIEKNAMKMPPRPLGDTFLSLREMTLSIIQGLIITAGVLFAYQLNVRNGGDENSTRTMVFCTLIFANIFLTMTNRSFYYSFISSMQNKNKLLLGVILLTLSLLAVMLYVPPVTRFFQIETLPLHSLLICAVISAISVLWFEVWKWLKRMLA